MALPTGEEDSEVSIASKVPPEEAEIALLEELDKGGGTLDTKSVVTRAIKHFSSLTPAELQRKTPSGREWWEGYFRFALDRLKRKGEATNRQRGWWAITEKGRQRIRREGLLEGRLVAVEAPEAIREEVTPFRATPEIRLERVHEQVETQLEEIGKIFGKYAKKEHHEAPYIYDVIWKEAEWLPRVTHAFEIQDKGNLIEALAKLKHAHDSWGSKLFLIVTGEKDRRKLDQLLEPHFMGTFHEIAGITTILSPEEVDELYKSLSRFKGVIERFLAR